jgi:hypothetical protein
MSRLVPVVGLALVVGASAASPSPGPEKWSAKVQPYVDIVEKERGLEFLRPVAVDFLAVPKFEDQVTDDEEELTDEDREDVEESTAFLRALGLIGGDVNLFDEVQRLSGAGVVGYYSFEDKRVRIRGEKLTPTTRSTLVHELTHALQDQYFDIGERTEALDEEDDGSASSAFRAIIEGDASRVETAYRGGLSSKEKAALTKAQRAEGGTFRRRSRGIPPVLTTLMGAPYALGEGLLTLAVALDGDDAVDTLFDEPPTTDEQLLDPWTLLVDKPAGEVNAPETPATGPGEKEFDSGTFGAFGWYVVLAQRLDARTTLEATDGWGGDAYSAYKGDGRSCVRVAFRGDTAEDVDQMASALDEWIAAGPPGARVRRDADGLVFSSCDPGAAEVPDPPTDAVLQLPVVRTVLTSQILDQGGAEDFTRCYIEKIIDTFPVEQITAAPADVDPAMSAQVQALAQECQG